MATDRVNLLPRDRRRSPLAGLQNALLVSWTGALLVMAVVSVLVLKANRDRQAQLEDLKKSASTLEMLIMQASEQAQSVEKIDRQLASTKQILESRAVWTELLKELSLIIPNSVWLTNFTTKEDAGSRLVELIGHSPSQTKIAEFLGALENSSYFHRVSLKGSDRLTDIRPDLYQFIFEIEMPRQGKKGAHGPAL